MVSTSSRAQRVWKRLTENYGSRFIDAYGAKPSDSWCEIIDRESDDTIRLALANVRATFLHHPPTLPEFESAVIKARIPEPKKQQVDVRSQLQQHVLHQHDSGVLHLTTWQLRNWQWLGKRRAIANDKGEMKVMHEIVGVVIPDDGDNAGLRVMLKDVVAEKAA
jgi:hypothetical protein